MDDSPQQHSTARLPAAPADPAPRPGRAASDHTGPGEAGPGAAGAPAGHRTLLLGGARSGKSVVAEGLLADCQDTVYVATGGDGGGGAEWAERVELHRARRPAGWTTAETVDLEPLLASTGPPLLIDCLSLWLTRVMDEIGAWDDAVWAATGAAELRRRVARLSAAWRGTPRRVVAVSNEVGSGVVPATRSGRRFRDELGRVNAALAAEADAVLYVVAGIPLPLHALRADTARPEGASAARADRADASPPRPRNACSDAADTPDGTPGDGGRDGAAGPEEAAPSAAAPRGAAAPERGNDAGRQRRGDTDARSRASGDGRGGAAPAAGPVADGGRRAADPGRNHARPDGTGAPARAAARAAAADRPPGHGSAPGPGDAGGTEKHLPAARTGTDAARPEPGRRTPAPAPADAAPVAPVPDHDDCSKESGRSAASPTAAQHAADAPAPAPGVPGPDAPAPHAPITPSHAAPAPDGGASAAGGGWRFALGTLSVLPVHVHRWDRTAARRGMAAAPAVGALLGLLAAVPAVALRAAGGGALLAALAAVAALAVLTRGLHLDGLADTADGLGSGRGAEGALRVMKASDIGPFGVVALVLVLGGQAAALARAFGDGWLPGAAATVTAAALGRLALVLGCRGGVPAARPGGLGAAVAGTVPSTAAALLTAAAVLGAAALGLLDGGPWGAVRGAGCAAAAVLAAVALLRHCVRRFGGITGDVLGALAETAATAALVVLALRP